MGTRGLCNAGSRGGKRGVEDIMKLLVLLLLPAVSLGHPRSCNFLDTNPFFNDVARSAPVTGEVDMLIQFARYMNARAPSLLMEFTNMKRVFDNQESARRLLAQAKGRINTIRAHRWRKGRQDDLFGPEWFGTNPASQAGTAVPPAEPVVDPVLAEPVVDPVVPAEPVVEPVVPAEPVVEPVVPAEPVGEPLVPTEPVVEPVVPAKPVVEPVVPTQPVLEPVVPAEPVVEPVVPAELVVEPVVPAEPVVPIRDQVSQQTTAFLNALTPSNAQIAVADAAGTLGSFVLGAILPNPDGEPEPAVVVEPVEPPSETFEAASQQTEQILDFLASNIAETLSNVHDAVNDITASLDQLVDKIPIDNINIPEIPIPTLPTLQNPFPTIDLPSLGEVEDSVSDGLGTFAETVQNVGETVQDAIVTFGQDVSETAQDFLGQHWNKICKVIWWPYHDEHCNSMRCTACAPTIMASAQVCKKTMGRVSSRCLADVMGGGGFCNYCIGDYINSY